ncbi:F-box/kelch-repeat protein At3g06240-like [Euphorbia lathyris]|uniref:F-box/kelch-repeat protein At3g06240-like n=1 Tax=Euphorbia lathyris TaxID=212925 RepID=UPI0033141DED
MAVLPQEVIEDILSRLPVKSILRFKSASKKWLFGFGYDSISDDYKIIGAWDSHLRICSLKTNSWKILEYSFKYSSAVTAVHSDGALYWCVGPQITAFDLAKEKILLLDLPEDIDVVGDYNSIWIPLFDYQGLLCASGRKSIWVMKEYGNSNSWAKLTTPLPQEYAKPVGISRLGEVVFCTIDGFVKSDMQGRMYDDDKSRMRHYADAFGYKESLISPECFDPKG